MDKIINQELYYDILLKKYNVLKKNLIIIEQTDEKKEEFKNTIEEIDKIEQDKFKKELEIKKELTTNLNDEYNRLCDYVNLLKERYISRSSMLDDYCNITKDYIDNLEEIEDYDNIDFFEKRLEDINEYLNNDEKYNKFIEEKNEYLRIKQEYQNKLDELKKVLDEQELNVLLNLKKSINNNNLYENLDFDNLDESINNYNEKLKEKEREFNTYLNSYKALMNVELVDNEKEDYFIFVNEEQKEFIDLLEKKYILLFYKYINDNEFEKVLEIYNERIEKLNKYDLENNFELKDILEIIKNYVKNKEYLNELTLTIDSIDNNINDVDNKIDSLKLELNKPNIINLLKEFCIEKEYIVNNKDEDNEILFEEEKNIGDTIITENDTNESTSIDDIQEIDIVENDNLFDEEILEENNIQENKSLDEILFDSNIEDNNLNELNFVDNIFEPENNINNEEINKEIIEESNDLDDNTNDEVIIDEEKDINEELIILEDLKDKEVIKENTIIEIKNINESLLIDNIRSKALSIMKSVCESIN